MARPAAVQVVGGRELRKELKAAGEDMSDLKGAHREAADMVAPVARAAAPVESGDLVASLRTSGTASASVIRAGGVTVPYGAPVHFGWPERNIKPNPFITEAARSTEPRWVALFKERVDQILSRIRGA